MPSGYPATCPLPVSRSGASSRVRPLDTAVRHPSRARSLSPAGLVQVPEELVVGLDHEDVPGPVERVDAGVDAAVERVELRVLAVGLGVNGGGTGVALAAHLLRLPGGVGDDHGALAIGARRALLGDLLSLGTAFRRPPRRLLAHLLVNGI